jgi:hypothetical protein
MDNHRFAEHFRNLDIAEPYRLIRFPAESEKRRQVAGMARMLRPFWVVMRERVREMVIGIPRAAFARMDMEAENRRAFRRLLGKAAHPRREKHAFLQPKKFDSAANARKGFTAIEFRKSARSSRKDPCGPSVCCRINHSVPSRHFPYSLCCKVFIFDTIYALLSTSDYGIISLSGKQEVAVLIRIIYGKKGTGKSRRLISLANEAHEKNEENAVFIDNDGDRMYMLNRNIRFINAGEFRIDGPKMFTGFLSGIADQDYDLQAIYINSFMKIVKHPLENLEEMFAFLRDFSEKQHVDLIISISGEGELPAYLAPLALE